MSELFNKFKLLVAALFIAMLSTSLLFPSPKVNAAAAPDLSKETVLNVSLEYNGTPIEGSLITAFRVAALSDGYMDFEVTDTFGGYAVDFDISTTSDWRDLALTLESYAVRDGIVPDVASRTDSAGAASLAFDISGLYLVCPELIEKNDSVYTPEAFLVKLPQTDENDEWIYRVAVSPKISVTLREREPITLYAVKVWDDKGKTASRPEFVEIQLLNGDDVFDTKTLSVENNWRTSWSDLDSGGDWYITEKTVPEGYTVSYSREGDTFVVTNVARTSITKDPQITKLPQTGQLWWPLPLLIVTGVALLATGAFLRHRYRDE